MLRRKPTAITLTSEDIAAYDDSRAERNRQQQENVNPANGMSSGGMSSGGKSSGGGESTPGGSKTTPGKGDGKVDPNDELKPLPGDRARIARAGAGAGSAVGREERIIGR
ncbi:hypothetical protein MMC28_006297 [Mycoblastus sanguinarius]|nr:hypothetical protein [Mycoblastus sanguinarius]